MSIWKQKFELEGLNAFNKDTMGEACQIVFTEIGPDYLVAEMPVTAAVVQPYRLLHGGANVVLAETLGSVASTMCVPDLNKEMAVGVEINANHLRSVLEGGSVRGICRPIRVGRTMHVWQIEISDDRSRLSCISRLTVAIISKQGGDT